MPGPFNIKVPQASSYELHPAKQVLLGTTRFSLITYTSRKHQKGPHKTKWGTSYLEEFYNTTI